MDEGESGLGHHLHTFLGQGEIADEMAVVSRCAAAVVADVVGSPTGAEPSSTWRPFRYPPLELPADDHCR